MSALAFEAVTHRFGRQTALDRVSLDVAAGEIVCLLGPSGCGKSTLLRIAAGLEPLQSGIVRLEGTVVAGPGVPDLPPERRRIGFLFQDFALFPHLTAAGNVAFGLHARGAAERDAAARAALHRVGMADFADAYPHTLSGGQQQRVALARAMAPQPRLFLLDEPFSGLDARLRRHILEDTRAILKSSGAASLVVTHDPEEANLLGDRIAVLRAGRLQQCGTPEDVYNAPANAFVVEFFGETNRLEAIVAADGTAATPFGAVPARGLPPGTRATVYIRHYGLTVYREGAAPQGAVPARVTGIRALGATRQFDLALDGLAAPLYARVSARLKAGVGDSVLVAANPGEVFVFPSETTT
jgi:iron(III) transport system ATP-binding protein